MEGHLALNNVACLCVCVCYWSVVSAVLLLTHVVHIWAISCCTEHFWLCSPVLSHILSLFLSLFIYTFIMFSIADVNFLLQLYHSHLQIPLHPSIHPIILHSNPATHSSAQWVRGSVSSQPSLIFSVYPLQLPLPPTPSSVHCALIKGRLCEHPSRQSHTVAPALASLTIRQLQSRSWDSDSCLGTLAKVRDWSLGAPTGGVKKADNLLLVWSGRAAGSGQAGAHMAQKTRFSRCRQPRL